jgi:dipeptidyl aminopeptidase/acylaminoacyl peptidase
MPTAPYGFWPSPITGRDVAESRAELGAVSLVPPVVLWLASDPSTGRTSLYAQDLIRFRRQRLTPPSLDVRSTLYGYGSGAFAADSETVVLTSPDHGILRLDRSGALVPLTASPGARYGDLALDARHRRCLAVREGPDGEVAIVAVDLAGAGEEVLEAGRGYYAVPTPSPTGERVAFLAWDAPDMPFDGARLHVAEVASSGRLGMARRIAGGGGTSVLAPVWDGTALVFPWDPDGFWNLHVWREGRIVPVVRRRAEFGTPGRRLLAVAEPGVAVVAVAEGGSMALHEAGLAQARLRPLAETLVDVGGLAAAGDLLAVTGASRDRPAALYVLRRSTGTILACVGERHPLAAEPPRALLVPTEDGRTVQAWFFPPAHPEVEGPADERPPLVVSCHGGPASFVTPAFNAEVRFYTSRGFAVVAANHAGSTGFGRAFREALYGRFGVLDRDDTLAVAARVFQEGLAAARVVYRGKSAGGFTVLACLRARRWPAAGVAYAAVTDLEELAEKTHRYERPYVRRLGGSDPEALRRRSALRHAEEILAPLLLLHGEADPVVPVASSRRLAEAIRAAGGTVRLRTFPGEGHSLRGIDAWEEAMAEELAFVRATVLVPGASAG